MAKPIVFTKTLIANMANCTVYNLSVHLPKEVKEIVNWQETGKPTFDDVQAFTIIKTIRKGWKEEEIKRKLYGTTN